jgi:predicted phosphodiesterase
MKFHYFSDIHLEITQCDFNFEKIDDSNNVCLLGDIGYPKTLAYKNFIRKISNLYKNVFLVYGNHEYYSPYNKYTMKDIEEEAINLPANVYFLNNTSVYINKETEKVLKQLNPETNNEDYYIKIIGSVLWSDINDTASSYMNDYKLIYTDKNKKLTPEFSRNLFYKNKSFILKELAENNFKSILLTHHAVHSNCNGIYKNNYLSSGFATDILELKKYENLLACINGHTHSNIKELFPGTQIKLLSNCFGYKKEEKCIFNPCAVLEI